jgi:hypothetical protein
MDVIVLAVELHELALEVLAYGPHDLLHAPKMNVLEHLVPELGHKNQVDMHHENTVPASANVLHVSHNPSM